jgi:hypothetical protein
LIGQSKHPQLKHHPGRTALRRSLSFLTLLASLYGPLHPANAQQPTTSFIAAIELPNSPGPQPPSQSSLATISGTVTDQDGASIKDARVTLTREGQAATDDPDARIVTSGSDGHFSFTNITPGSFNLSILAAGFATRQTSIVLHSGETYEAPPISLPAASSIEVQAVSQYQEAEEQIKAEEKQNVLGFIPNFYVSYVPNPVPLAAKQKFELAWKTTINPTSFAFTGVIAGIQQSQNSFSGYGQGVQGYAKRYGASYATFFNATMIGNAILPALLKQDPRYFYKGTGTTKSRVLYALATSVICKGDNGHWQPNYSGILGSLAAGGISNLYYPAANRDGVSLTFENALIGVAATGIGNLFQEFVILKLTPHVIHPAYTTP